MVRESIISYGTAPDRDAMSSSLPRRYRLVRIVEMLDEQPTAMQSERADATGWDAYALEAG